MSDSGKSKFLSVVDIDGIKALCVRYKVRSLFLFGSAVSDPDSARDVDFAVEFGPASPAEHVERYFGLMEGIQSLLGKPVDLVEMRAIRNPFFKQEIEEKKVLLYDAA